MSGSVVICYLVVAVLQAATAVDESLFMKWPEFTEHIEGHNFMGVALLDGRAEVSNILDHLNSRWSIKVLPSGEIVGKWDAWNKLEGMCFSRTFHLTSGSDEFVSFEDTITGRSGVEIETIRRFISSQPDKYVLVLVCAQSDGNGKCVDGIVELSIREDLYDKDQDGKIDDIDELPKAEMNADAMEAFNLEKVDFEQIWTLDVPRCPLQAAN